MLQVIPPAIGNDFKGGDVNLSGYFEPHSTINILLNGETVATVLADAVGQWEQVVNVTGDGEHTVMMSGIAADGRVVLSGAYSIFIGMEKVANAPKFTSLDSVSGSAVSAAGEALQNVNLQQQVVGGAGEVAIDIPLLQLALADKSAVSVRLTGEGRPDASLDVYRNGNKVGTTRVSPDGIWFISAPLDTNQPDQRFVAVYQDANGALVTSDPVLLRVALLPAPTLAIETIQFDNRSTLVNSDGEFVGKLQLAGTGQPAGARLTIFINDQAVGSTDIDNDFNWQQDLIITAPLNESVVLKAVLRDDAASELADTVEQRIDLPQLAGNLSVELSPRLPAVSAAGLPAVSLIVDASWSMTEPMGDSTRVQVAQRALENVVQFIVPENYPLSVRAFGNVEGDFSCRTDLIVPLQPMNRAVIQEVLGGISPQFNANSPIAKSLSAAGEDLSLATGAKRIVLLTDGMETCKGNPAAVVRQLRDAHDIRVDVIGFAIDDAAVEAELFDIATAGGGMYINADDGDSLADALEAVLSVRYFVLSEGQVLETGLVGGTPVTMPYGRYTVVVETTPALEYDIIVDDTETTVIVE